MSAIFTAASQSPDRAAHCRSPTDRYKERMCGRLGITLSLWGGRVIELGLCPEGTGEPCRAIVRREGSAGLGLGQVSGAGE